MTRFNHQARSGRRKKPKPRARRPIGLGKDIERLLAHRELEYLRAAGKRGRQAADRVAARARKLTEAEQANAAARRLSTGSPDATDQGVE